MLFLIIVVCEGVVGMFSCSVMFFFIRCDVKFCMVLYMVLVRLSGFMWKVSVFILVSESLYKLLMSLLSVDIFVCNDVSEVVVSGCMLFFSVFSLLCSIVRGVCSLCEMLVVS